MVTDGEGRVLGGQPHHCVCTNASHGLSAIAEFLVCLSYNSNVSGWVWTCGRCVYHLLHKPSAIIYTDSCLYAREHCLMSCHTTIENATTSKVEIEVLMQIVAYCRTSCPRTIQIYSVVYEFIPRRCTLHACVHVKSVCFSKCWRKP